MMLVVKYHYHSLFTYVLQLYYNLLFFAVWACVQNFYIILTNVVTLPVFLCWMHMMITHNIVQPSLWHSHAHTSVTHIFLSSPLINVPLPVCFFVSILHHLQLSLYNLTIILPKAPDHSAPRSWHERDFCLKNLPTSRSRGYRGTRLDRKRLAREVMLSRWPPPLMSSALVPGGQGGCPLASRTTHSRSSGVRWSREAEISR